MNTIPNESTGPCVLTSIDAGVATLTLNRPSQMNALSLDMLDALRTSLDAIALDRTVRVVVMAANGKVFCPGHDLKQMLAHRTREFVAGVFKAYCDIMLLITRMPQPVIAKVHATATAAGCQLVATCDLAVASTNARFATSGINFGLFCATPGVAVSRAVARKHALEMLLTGEFIDAASAREWGLVNRVVAPDELDTAVARLAAVLVDKPPAVLAAGKKFFYEQIGLDTGSAYELATEVITNNMLSPEAAEGASAFVAKRKPNW